MRSRKYFAVMRLFRNGCNEIEPEAVFVPGFAFLAGCSLFGLGASVAPMEFAEDSGRQTNRENPKPQPAYFSWSCAAFAGDAMWKDGKLDSQI